MSRIVWFVPFVEESPLTNFSAMIPTRAIYRGVEIDNGQLGVWVEYDRTQPKLTRFFGAIAPGFPVPDGWEYLGRLQIIQHGVGYVRHFYGEPTHAAQSLESYGQRARSRERNVG